MTIFKYFNKCWKINDLIFQLICELTQRKIFKILASFFSNDIYKYIVIISIYNDYLDNYIDLFSFFNKITIIGLVLNTFLMSQTFFLRFYLFRIGLFKTFFKILWIFYLGFEIVIMDIDDKM